MNELLKTNTRRIMAITFSLAGAVVLSLLSIQGDSNAFTALVAIVSAITSFYFGTRLGENGGNGNGTTNQNK